MTAQMCIYIFGDKRVHHRINLLDHIDQNDYNLNAKEYVNI